MIRQLRAAWAVLSRHLSAPWYPFAVGFMAALDILIMVIPLDAVAVAGVLSQRSRWWLVALNCAMGSLLGALVLWALVAGLGVERLQEALPYLFTDPRGERVQEWIARWGPWAAALNAFGPLPQALPLLPAFITEASIGKTLACYLAGRSTKYLVYCSVAAMAPRLLSRLPGLRGEMEELGEQEARALERIAKKGRHRPS